MKRLAATLLLLAPGASAYYHFVRYNTRTGPFTPIVQKFDLNALAGKTVQYFLPEQAPASLAAGDSYASVVSEIRAAAQVWNDIPTSDLRVAFGGIRPTGTPMNAPGIEVIFDEITPGVIAYGGPITTGEAITGANGTFVPVMKSQVVLGVELMKRQSYSERFFLTVVHEFGHAIGLQHTWTSGVMSTEVTRASAKAQPLSADDVAGVSLLYPAAGYSQAMGSITGRVTLNGSGVSLASVVALTPTGPAVAALTDPDGNYRIDGLVPGNYFVYAHPLPPAMSGELQPVNIVLPTAFDSAYLPGPAFDLQFYPQSRQPNQTVSVGAGAATNGIDFQVQQRAGVNIYSGVTYSFYGAEAVKPAQLLLGAQLSSIYFWSHGSSTNTGPVPGLSVTAIGALEQITNVQAYPPREPDDPAKEPDDPAKEPVYLQIDVQPHPFSQEGPRHLMLSAGGESYILPSAFRYSVRRAPAIDSVISNPDRSLTLSGPNMGPGTRILFDGVQVPVRLTEDGRLTVNPPSAPGGHHAVIAALNPDGQSSLMTMGANSPVYQYDFSEIPQLSVSPSVLPAGVETTIELTGASVTFRPGEAAIGFGTSDITVKKLWVSNSRRLLANVVVNLGAFQGVYPMTAVAGLQLNRVPGAVQIVPATGSDLYVPLSAVAPAYYLAGGSASLPVANLPAGAVVTASVSDRPAGVISVTGNTVNFQIPAGIAPGPAVVRFSANGQPVLPITIVIDPPPASIVGAQTISGQPITPAAPARSGDAIQLVISGLLEAGYSADTSRLRVSSGALEHKVQLVQAAADRPGLYWIQVLISPDAPAGQPLALTLSVDGRTGSQPFVVPLR